MLTKVRDWINTNKYKLIGSRVLTIKEAADKYNAMSGSWMYHLIHHDDNFAKCVIKNRTHYLLNERKFRNYLVHHWYKVEEME